MRAAESKRDIHLTINRACDQPADGEIHGS